MKLSQNEKSFLFSSLELPNVFFTEYVPQLSGDCLKVYLYILFLSKYNKEVNLNDLAKKLCISIKLVKDCMTSLEEFGVITKKTNGYLINDLQELELHNLYTPKLTSSPEDIKTNKQNQYRAKVIENINNTYFQGTMSPSWYNDIDLWFNKYGFDEQVMFTLFNFCSERASLNRNYVKAIAETWSKNSIRDYNDLEVYYQKQEKVNLIKKSICKKLGFNRPLTIYEGAYVDKWVLDFNYSIEIIEIALKRTTSKMNPNFEYLDKLLSDWHERGFHTVAEINIFLSDMKKKTKDVKDLEKKAGYHNYDQRSYQDLDSLYANKTSLG